MASELDQVESLVRDLIKMCPNGGFRVNSLVDTIEGVTANLTTVLRFLPSISKAKLIEKTVDNTRMSVLISSVDVNEAFSMLAEVQKSGAFEIAGRRILLDREGPTRYGWRRPEQIQRKNGAWTYGTDLPATLISYSEGKDVPNVQTTGNFMGIHHSVSDLIWFEIVSENDYRPDNLSIRHFNQRGIHLLVPHWHAHIGSVLVMDNEILVELKSDIGGEVWDSVSVSDIMQYHDSTVSKGRSSPVGSDGKCRLPCHKTNIRSAEITVILQPKGTSKQYWADTEWSEKQISGTNGRLNTHQFFDASSELLERKLLKPDTDSQGFEWAIAVFLHLVGYQVEWWGYQWKDKTGVRNRYEIDVLAIDVARKKIMAVECTTSTGDIQRKVQNVGARATKLAKETPGWEVLPMVCIPLSYAEASAAGHPAVFASPGNVRILNADGIAQILKLIKAGYPHDVLAKELTGG